MNVLSLINAGKLGLIMLLVAVALLACNRTIQLTPITPSVPTPTLAPPVTRVPTPTRTATRIIMPPVATLKHSPTPLPIPISIDPGTTKLVTGDSTVISVAPEWRKADLTWEITFVSSNLIADPGKLSSFNGPTIGYIAPDQPGQVELTVTGRLPEDVVGSTSVTFLIGLPSSQKPFLIFGSGHWANPGVLDALSLGVDWNLLNDILAADGRNSRVNLEARTSQGQLTRRDLQLTGFDPERARRLMAEAGFPDGFQSSWCITSGSSTADFATVMGKFLDRNLNITFGEKIRDSSACQVAQQAGKTVLSFDQPD